ncbi:MAG: DUF1320 domain-containing protein [Prevotella sp.]|nr:DUF1320 domain-containing protein [Prevotella sp.]
MSEFIDLKDYDASIHREILDSLTRADHAVVEICEDRAIEEMRSYMSGRYDCDAVFSARGGDRSQLVLMMALDIAIYHIFSIHNPQKLSQLRRDRYERAVEWLKQISRGEISVDGLPLASDEDQVSHEGTRLLSNPKRTNHF